MALLQGATDFFLFFFFIFLRIWQGTNCAHSVGHELGPKHPVLQLMPRFVISELLQAVLL